MEQRELHLETVRDGELFVNPLHLQVEGVRRNGVKPLHEAQRQQQVLFNSVLLRLRPMLCPIVAASVFCVPRLVSLFHHSAVFIVLQHFVFLRLLCIVVSILKCSGASLERNRALNNFSPASQQRRCGRVSFTQTRYGGSFCWFCTYPGNDTGLGLCRSCIT